jgi:UDPglucose 6-dehydrogenase
MEIKNYSKKNTVVVIKSTIAPKTCRTLHDIYGSYNFTIIFCPEFLREKTANKDAYNAKFLLLGSSDKNVSSEIIGFFKKLYAHNKDIILVQKTYEVCEIFKYTLNTYFATKITFFNEIYELCEVIGVEYDELKDLFCHEPRIGEYGTIVPGVHGKGYSGTCLPKEVLGMINLRKELGLSSELMTLIDKRNNEFRS